MVGFISKLAVSASTLAALAFEVDAQVISDHRAKEAALRLRRDGQGSLGKQWLNEGVNQINGVNLGGWLVTEPFINPSLYERFRTSNETDDGIPTDEYEMCSRLGPAEAERTMVQHWSTWITEEDFANIAKAGLNTVRVPIGYWAFKTLPGDPYVTGHQEGFLDQAIEWARKYNLKIWVDLHGAPGSQNGFDNSGRRGEIHFQEPQNMQLLTEVVHYILEKYSRNEFADIVTGIEILNEPYGSRIDLDSLREFYHEAFTYLRYTLKRDTNIVLQSAFMPRHYWDNFMTGDDGSQGIIFDHHDYVCYTPGKYNATLEEKTQLVCKWGWDSVFESHWSVVGEWSSAITDCAHWLNGVGRGHRYDGSLPLNITDPNSLPYPYSGSCENSQNWDAWSEQNKSDHRALVEAQMDAFDLRGGWIYWCWKTENQLEWDLQRLLGYGIFPQPLTDRKFPRKCQS